MRMKKYLFSALAVLAVACTLLSCGREPLDPVLPSGTDGSVTFNEDGLLCVNAQLEIPEMSAAATRALGETPNFSDLSLYLLVFEEGEGLKQSVRLENPKPVPGQSDSEHDHNALVTFRLLLEPTAKAATVHLIATDQPDFRKMIGYGTEERVITALYTADGHEAYWQRIAFGFNIPSEEQTKPENKDVSDPNRRYTEEAARNAAEIGRRLSHIPMIRNFCRVSVDNSSPDFTLKGLYVINTVDRGSVAPYVTADRQFVAYHDTEDGKYVGKSYADISAQHHIGSLPVGVQLINTGITPGEISTKSEDLSGRGDVQPVYFYERPARVNSTERTYVIIRGRRKNNEKDSFYKIDLGYTVGGDDEVGIFEYYNLLRNFDYEIHLLAVDSDGYASMADAAKGAVFNNFSAAIEARNMTSVSDGDDMIFVNFTSYVFTQPNQWVDLLAQYRTNVGNGSGGDLDNGHLKYKLMTGTGQDALISKIDDPSPKENPEWGSDWRSFRVYGPTNTEGKIDNLLRQQTVYVYHGKKDDGSGEYGLYRVINFFSHEPWTFDHIDTFPGLWESWDGIDEIPSWDWTEDQFREVGQSKGAPLTLFFELPAGLPQALFPLEFVIESDRQNIQNAYAGNAVVQSVPAEKSLFYRDPTLSSGSPTTSRIQYVKTVSWEDYFGKWSEDLVDDGTGTGNRIVRCRFLTISDLDQDVIGDANGQSSTTLRVSNPYFAQIGADGKWTSTQQDGFMRNNKTSDPTPRFWDFSSGIWDEVMGSMGSGSTLSRQVDGLSFYGSGMSNGTDDAGLRYVRLSNNNDRLSHSHTYDSKQKRTIRLAVVSTAADGTPMAPRITASSETGGNVTIPGSPTEMVPWSKNEALMMYIYDIDVPAAVTAVTLNVSPAVGTTTMRCYEIDFFPRWDELMAE